MPLIFIRTPDPHARLGLWKIEETSDALKEQVALDPGEEILYASFKSEVRKKQWLSCRALLSNMFSPDTVSLEYNVFGKPQLKNGSLHISISHSGEYSAVITSNSSPVGIDIEQLKERIHRIKDRFLTPAEDQNIGADHRLEKLYIAWGAKEALYKIHGKPEVDFQGDIEIGPFDYLCSGKGRCNARMTTPGGPENFDVFYEKILGYMLVYALKAV
jgi:4'-phosphopantetheinyl transferase